MRAADEDTNGTRNSWKHFGSIGYRMVVWEDEMLFLERFVHRTAFDGHEMVTKSGLANGHVSKSFARQGGGGVAFLALRGLFLD